jgi:hypothetical protein
VTTRWTILQAIRDRLRLRVRYKGQERILDPYLLYETHAGAEILHGWQVDGAFEHSKPPDWCNLKLDQISRATLAEPYGEPQQDYNPESSNFYRIIAATPKGPAVMRAQ